MLSMHIQPNFDIQPNGFTISQEMLAKLVESNDEYSLPINEVLIALQTDVERGIRGDACDLENRHKTFGSNQLNYEEYSSDNNHGHIAKEFQELMLEALKDSSLILLFCCALLSLVIEIRRNGLKEGLFDGVIIFLSLIVIVIFGVTCRYCNAKWRLNKNFSNKGKKSVGALRCGKLQHISAHEVVVGDILLLNSGDDVPADGLLIQGNSFLRIDDGVVHELEFFDSTTKHFYMFSGSKVVSGCCKMLVTLVGKYTERRKLMRSMNSIRKEEYSKLEDAICKTTSRLEKVWLCLSLLILVVQLVRCFIWESKYCNENHNDLDPKGVKDTVEEMVKEGTKLVKREHFRAKALVGVLCALLFALRDGVPIGIFILLACVSRKMKKTCYAIVQNVHACATSGYVTTVCIGGDGVLAIQPMKMANLWIGLQTINQNSTEVAPEVLNALGEAICGKINDDFAEDSLLLWAHSFLGISNTVHRDESFSCNAFLKRRRKVENNCVHMYYRGIPQSVLPMCSHYYHADGTMQNLDQQKMESFNQILESMTSDCLHCFAFAYKNVVFQEEQENDEQVADTKLTLIGLLGLRNPISPEVKQAVQSFKKSGIEVKLLVSKDAIEARLMAFYSGIINQEESIIEASECRNVTEEELMNMIDKIHVVANATQLDKLLVLQCLRKKGRAMAAIGTSIRDLPLLIEADIGIFFGGSAAEMANELPDIIVTDKNFVTILAILKMGRYVCKIVEKFIVLQLTLNISAFTINFLTVMSTSVEPLSQFELLWVNLIVDIFGALALAALMVEAPSLLMESIKMIYEEGSAMIGSNMWRQILAHCSYQVVVCFVLNSKGKAIFDVNETVLGAMIFNCFVICQLFLLIEARGVTKTFVYERRLWVAKLSWFFMIVSCMVVLHVSVVEILSFTSGMERLNIKQWSICVGLASGSVLIDLAAKWGLNSCVVSYLM